MKCNKALGKLGAYRHRRFLRCPISSSWHLRDEPSCPRGTYGGGRRFGKQEPEHTLPVPPGHTTQERIHVFRVPEDEKNIMSMSHYGDVDKENGVFSTEDQVTSTHALEVAK